MMITTLEEVLRIEPLLTRFGIESLRDKERHDIKDHPFNERIVLTIANLLCTYDKTMNTRHGYSYSMKHTCENIFGEYVANGEFIAGAIMAGFTHYLQYDLGGRPTPNCYFNFYKKDVIELDELGKFYRRSR